MEKPQNVRNKRKTPGVDFSSSGVNLLVFLVLEMAICPCTEAGCISGIAFILIGNLGKIRGLEEQASRISRFAVESIANVRNRAESREMMDATIDAPQQWVKNIAMLRLPDQADRRLQQLMDRNNEGLLTEQERADLAAWAELSEQLSLVRAEALHLLGRKL